MGLALLPLLINRSRTHPEPLTLRQAAYGLGIAVVITLIARGAGDDIATFQPAWWWSAGCYFVAAIAVMLTFPAGSSEDRAAVSD